MKQKITLILAVIFSIAGTIIVKDYTSLDEILGDIMKHWNNSNAVTNTVGVSFIGLATMALSYLFSTKKTVEEKEQSIKIDLTNATEETRALAQEFKENTYTFKKILENQMKINENQQTMNEMFILFSVNTNINETVKNELINKYSNIKNNVIDLTKEVEKYIDNTIEKVSQVVETTKTAIEETKKQTKSIIDRYRDELK